MNKLLTKLFLALSLLCMGPLAGYAQSASDSYNKGVALMNKGDYQGAIASFKASMAINKSASNVKKCKAQINKCNRLAKQKDGGETAAPKTKVLNTSASALDFNAETETMKVVGIETQPESNDWLATVPKDAEDWCKLAKSMDGKELQVTCYPSESTILRKTIINVTYLQLSRQIEVVQRGIKVNFYAETPFVSLSKRKGGQKQVSITCNSDTLYENKMNWTVVKSPEWCQIQVPNKDLMIIKADKVAKESPDFKNGRTGDIIMRSQGQEFVIRIDQK